MSRGQPVRERDDLLAQGCLSSGPHCRPDLVERVELGLRMTAPKRSVSIRSRLMAVAATIVIPATGMGLTVGGATSALADEPASFVATTVPFSSAISASTLLDVEPTDNSISAPIYQTIASGKASYYGRELAGNRTASGERFNPSDLTAAHRTLPLGSKVRVTNAKTGVSVIVRINDRGPFHGNRVIDMSEAAARQIGIKAAGSGMVDLAVQSD